ncbi:hypothetical protein BU17DRAFT_79912 [Hysterangium stoloniferum]|nr:hypothetical protein BU17DRAFT_79912 [Hysterangium stoloniferum]
MFFSACSLSSLEIPELARKRGPPKGYLSALEQRLNNAEALLGAIICSTDARARSLISDVSSDPLASSIISRIRDSEFGLAGRAVQDTRQYRPNMQTESWHSSTDMPQEHDDQTSTAKLDAVFSVPSVEWQDCLNLRMALGSKKRKDQELSAVGTWDTQRPQAEHPTWNAMVDSQVNTQLSVVTKDEDIRVGDMGSEDELLEDDPLRSTDDEDKYTPHFPTQSIH